jgi:hypothetical protein
LPPHLSELDDVRDGFRPLIHVAPTARREAYSCLIPGLKDAERPDPEKRKQQQAPAARRSKRQESGCTDHGDRQRCEAESQPMPLALRADVRDGSDGSKLERSQTARHLENARLAARAW